MIINRNNYSLRRAGAVLTFATAIALGGFASTGFAADAGGPREMSPGAKQVEHKSDAFGADPSYEDKAYSPEAQIDIYGGKKPVEVVDPLVELFRPIYEIGPLGQGNDTVGEKNLIFPALSVFGDWRTAVAYNDNGGVEVGQVATRLNLDVDLKLTATERLHGFFRPIDKGGKFSRYEFFGGDRDQGDFILDGNIETLFFEGDVGQIWSGISGTHAKFDLPIALGLTPFLFQNGVWLEDAFIGGGASIMAKNSPTLDISNMDFTVFGGFDKVTSPAVKNADGVLNDDKLYVFGLAAFIEANRGYWEAGYGFIDGRTEEFDDLGYHSLTLAFTRRYGGLFSNSLRAVWTFGQDRDNNAQQTADGVIFLMENSFVTSKPSTLVPYFNAWVGFDRPQPLADDTGLLKNTGINFETDALTGFPKLDDTGHDTFGGALGVQYLFNLDRQLVLEVATVQKIGGVNEAGRAAVDDQYAFGIRYQHPISPAWIVRADAMYGLLQSADDIKGARLELRRKF
jgi:hypothetical protein